MPDRIRGVSAIAENLLVGVVTLHDLILFEGDQEFEERRRRNVKTLYRCPQRYHDRMTRLAVAATHHLFAPPAQQIKPPLPPPVPFPASSAPPAYSAVIS